MTSAHNAEGKHISYQTAKAHRDKLDANVAAAGATLNQYPKLPNGLTPDSAKTPQWRADRAAFNQAFEALRRFNAVFVKRYKKEIREERASR